MIGAGLMTKPADGVWLIAGTFDGSIPEQHLSPQISLQLLDSAGGRVDAGLSEAVDIPDIVIPAHEEGARMRVLIQIQLPPLSELAPGIYGFQVTFLSATQVVPFGVPEPAEVDPA